MYIKNLPSPSQVLNVYYCFPKLIVNLSIFLILVNSFSLDLWVILLYYTSVVVDIQYAN